MVHHQEKTIINVKLLQVYPYWKTQYCITTCQLAIWKFWNVNKCHLRDMVKMTLMVMWVSCQWWSINGVAQYGNWYLGEWRLCQILYDIGLCERRINNYHLQQGHMIIKSWTQLFLIRPENKHPLCNLRISEIINTAFNSHHFSANQSDSPRVMWIRNVSSQGKEDESKLSPLTRQVDPDHVHKMPLKA